MPGTKTLKKGIYSFPSFVYAFDYAHASRSSEDEISGWKVLVCAALLGKTFNATNDRELHGAISDGYDSMSSTVLPEYMMRAPTRFYQSISYI